MARSYPSSVARLAYRNPDGASRSKYAARNVAVGDVLRLVPEPENPDDRWAVAVIHNGFQLGYIPAWHDWVSVSLDNGNIDHVVVTAVKTKGWLFKRAVQIDIRIAVVDDR
jgi:hypothetical protein